MKTVYFVRHAKSCWNNNLEDFDRPLKNRGVKDANLVSNYLLNKNVYPDLILCSAANRTKLTAAIFIKNLGLENTEIKFLKSLYDFSGDSVLNALKQLNNTINSVMLFGHNYALTNLVNSLGNTSITNVTTSGYVQIDFHCKDWNTIEKGETKLVVFPKNLK